MRFVETAHGDQFIMDRFRIAQRTFAEPDAEGRLSGASHYVEGGALILSGSVSEMDVVDEERDAADLELITLDPSRPQLLFRRHVCAFDIDFDEKVGLLAPNRFRLRHETRL